MKRFRWVALAAVVAVGLGTTVTVASAQEQQDAEPQATDVGITAKEIRVGIVADVDSPLAPGLFKGAVSAVRAWAKWVNKTGGLAGRKVVVDFYDSRINPNEARNSIIAACQKDFALVGTSVVFLNNPEDETSCPDKAGKATGLPDVPVVVTNNDEGCAPNVFPINPPTVVCSTRTDSPQTYQSSAGRAFWYQKKFGKDLHGLYLLSGDSQAAKNANIASLSGLKSIGIEQDAEESISGRAPQAQYTPLIQQMKQNGSNFATIGGSVTQEIFLRKEAAVQGLTSVKVWDCTLQCYDPRLIAEGGKDVDGTYVSLLFLPFEEGKSNQMLATFLKYVGRQNADGFGAQAWAAGVLFQQAIEAIVKAGGVNAVDRAALIKQLGTINSFDAEGMIGTTNIAKKQVTPCYALLQVTNGKFKRVYPTKAGTFDCTKKNLQLNKISIT